MLMHLMAVCLANPDDQLQARNKQNVCVSLLSYSILQLEAKQIG